MGVLPAVDLVARRRCASRAVAPRLMVLHVVVLMLGGAGAALAQAGPGRGYYIADTTGTVKVLDQGPGTFTLPKEAGLSVAERRGMAPRVRALVNIFAEQPWLKPPKGFDAEFSIAAPYVLAAKGPVYQPYIYGFSFGAFNYYWRQGRRGREPFREIAQNLTGAQVNAPPDRTLVPKDGPMYELEPPVFAHPEPDTMIAGFAVYRGNLHLTHLDLEKFWKPVSVEYMLRAMVPLLQKDRDGELALLVSMAAAARGTYTAPDWAKLRQYHADEMASTAKEYAKNDKAREQRLASLDRRWIKDSLSRVDATVLDTLGPKGARYRMLRDSVAAVAARVDGMSPDDRGKQACGTAKDQKVALNYWEIHAAANPGTGARRCWPLVTFVLDGWRTDLSRTAFQLIAVPAGFTGKCPAEVGDPDNPKTFEPGGCVANVRLVRRVDWSKVATLLDH